MVCCHLSINNRNSLSSSAALLSSATVRTMIPKPAGLIESNSCFKRWRSASRLIFCDTITPSAKGMRTIFRPAIEISAVRRGPLVFMGSLET